MRRRGDNSPMTSETADDATIDMTLHRGSHLAATPTEVAFTEFEFALHHIVESFRRWSVELNTYVSDEALPVQDVSVLQVVRMKDRPKSAAEIGKFLNREDAANVQYTLRKLERAGLIERVGGAPRNTMYQVTEHGRDVTNRYAQGRREFLVPLVEALAEPSELLEAVTKRLWLLVGFYDQSARTVSMLHYLPRPEFSTLKAQTAPNSRRPGRAAKPRRSQAAEGGTPGNGSARRSKVTPAGA